ncbi:hypothetical protein KMP95_21555 [Ruegeria litorea]|nr:hypothetical protein [Falsiruegeria litorea]MBT8170961.1 hypothetical protein [Falsiruegeria litorea]
MSAFDRADCLYAVKGPFCIPQGTEALSVSEEPSHRGVVVFHSVVAPFSADVPEAFGMQLLPLTDRTNDAAIGVCLVRADRDGLLGPNAFDSLVKKSSCSLCIPPRGQVEINHLLFRIDHASKVAPLPTNTDLGLACVPIYTRPVKVFLGPFGQFGTELLNPANPCGSINGVTAFRKQIYNIQIGQRLAQVSTHNKKD